VTALAFVTGFGAFEDVEANASGELALALAADPPNGLEVHSGLLPVSFRRAPEAWDQHLASFEPRRPGIILCMGVHKADGFRLERRARLRIVNPDRSDVDGGATLEGVDAPSADFWTPFDLEALVAQLEGAAPQRLSISEDAGGYVCERVYHHSLARAERISARALFLHVPRVETLAVRRQFPFVRRLLESLAHPPNASRGSGAGERRSK
jgi:pyrrolidone-carboxylate peptidase